MTDAQTAEIFGFIKAAAAYLDGMAGRGDNMAAFLHCEARDILAEHGEGED